MEYVLGLDIGTSTSITAFVDEHGRVQNIPDPRDKEKRIALPSVIGFKKDLSLITGFEAAEWQEIHPERCIASIKRQLCTLARANNKDRCAGPVLTDSSAGPIVEFEKKQLAVSALLACQLSYMKECAESFIGKQVKEAVLVLSRNFGNKGKGVFRLAAEEAGLRICDEISDIRAMAAAYEWEGKLSEGKAAFCDLGAGGIKIGIADVQSKKVRVLSEIERDDVGAQDVDCFFSHKILKEVSAAWDEDMTSDEALAARIMGEVSHAKTAVSHRGSYDLRLTDESKGRQFTRAVSRFELADITREVAASLIDTAEEALKAAGVQRTQLDHLILAGGWSRMQVIQEMLEQAFEVQPQMDLNPEAVVSLGAAVQGSKARKGRSA